MNKMGRLGKGKVKDWPSLALLEFTVSLVRAMKANGGMRPTDLATALRVSRSYISSVLAGNENLTIEQMSRLADAAGGALHLAVTAKGFHVRWVEDVLEDADRFTRPLLDESDAEQKPRADSEQVVNFPGAVVRPKLDNPWRPAPKAVPHG